MGIAYAGLGEFEKTIEVCKKAIKIKPDSRAYYTIGLSCARLGESEKAINGFFTGFNCLFKPA
jgi:tetratricopeptide (TPR) repeat protein